MALISVIIVISSMIVGKRRMASFFMTNSAEKDMFPSILARSNIYHSQFSIQRSFLLHPCHLMHIDLSFIGFNSISYPSSLSLL